MHKLIQANVNKILYKIEDSIEITNVVLSNIKDTGEILNINTFSIYNLSYIKLETPVEGKILVIYDIKSQEVKYREISTLVERIRVLEEAIKKRVTDQDINLYLEKFRVLSQ